MFYIKPNLKNMSQGARLQYVRKLRYLSKDDVAEKIDKYNSYIENFNYDNSGKIGNISNYYYKEENIKCINRILD